MTTIKPPAGPATGPSIPTVEPNGATGPEVAGAAQGTAAAAASTAAAGSDAIRALAQQLHSGALTPEQAVERLLSRATEGVGAYLAAAERQELLRVLQSALDHDPTLRALRDDLG